MTQYIVTRQNKDGTYDEVGMDQRCIISGYKTFRNAFKYGINPFGRGAKCRVEVYGSSVYTPPLKVMFVDTYSMEAA